MSESRGPGDGAARTLRLFGKLTLLPMAAMVAGAEAMAQVARGLREAAGQSVDTLTDGLVGGGGASRPSEGGMLSDGQPKLVDVGIASTREGREEVLHREQIVVVEPMSAEAFRAWRMAEYLRGEGASLAAEERDSLRLYFKVLDRWVGEEAT